MRGYDAWKTATPPELEEEPEQEREETEPEEVTEEHE